MTNTTQPEQRRAALVAGFALLALALLAGWANLAGIQPAVVAGDAAATAERIAASATTFRLGILAMFGAAALDVVVAWALRTLFAPVAGELATLAAWFRLAYAAIFVAAIGRLLGAVRAAQDPTSGVSALGEVDAFTDLWNLSLALFGVHLLLVGVLTWRSGHAPRLIAVLVAVAGTGYLLDGVQAALLADPAVGFAQFAFVGEIAFLAWLIAYGFGVRTARSHRVQVSVIGPR